MPSTGATISFIDQSADHVLRAFRYAVFGEQAPTMDYYEYWKEIDFLTAGYKVASVFYGICSGWSDVEFQNTFCNDFQFYQTMEMLNDESVEPSRLMFDEPNNRSIGLRVSIYRELPNITKNFYYGCPEWLVDSTYDHAIISEFHGSNDDNELHLKRQIGLVHICVL
uniref:Uncharacterized protein n=1 Tax=Parascaris equorum TaxID=6256 RepID=A0A914S5Z5_PAREQ